MNAADRRLVTVLGGRLIAPIKGAAQEEMAGLANRRNFSSADRLPCRILQKPPA